MHDFLARFMGANLADTVIQYGLNLLLALVILLVGIWLAARLANFTQRALQRANVDDDPQRLPAQDASTAS